MTLRFYKTLTKRRIILLCLGLMVLLYSTKLTYSILHWKAYVWLPDYMSASRADEPDAPAAHLVFVMVDHYEPGRGEAGFKRHKEWTKKFIPIAKSHKDSYGNTFRYSWFYPYDEHNEQVLASLASLSNQGYGEVELHWHHPRANNQEFAHMLEEALPWFHKYGALVSSGESPTAQFAFVHGNWCLDNSTPACGVTRELDILREHGCYADLTFSTIGTDAQPSKVNSIYYARDSDENKSYNTGIDVCVGKEQSDSLMLIQGPTHINWMGHINYGAVESYALPTGTRIEQWIDANIHVQGRPEWVFVKVYTHGCMSIDIFENGHLDAMLNDLSSICNRRKLQLHYMTARECYNVIKAAEQGLKGNPEDYRDYRLPKPLNLVEPPPKIEADHGQT